MKERGRAIRLTVLMGLSLLLAAGIFGRLAQFQVVEGETLRQKAENEITTVKTIPAARGEIVDRYGRVLAGNRTSCRLVLDRTGLSSAQLNTVLRQLLLIADQEGVAWETISPLGWSGGEPVFLQEDGREQLAAFLELPEDASAGACAAALLERFGLEEETRLNLDLAGLRYSMARQADTVGSRYPVAEELSSEAVIRLEEEAGQLPGVEIEEVPVRTYENGETASHLIGTIGPIYAEEYEALREQGYAMDDLVGKSGIESAMEEVLRGQDGRVRTIQSRDGTVLQTVVEQQVRAGSRVELSIDALFQQRLQELLEEFVSTAHSESYRSQGGAIVVLEVETGEVLAAVNAANYTIEEYRSNYAGLLADEKKPLFNRALNGIYRPGSSLKPMVAVAALQTGKLTPEEELLCVSPYHYLGQDYTCLQDHHAGYLPLSEALHWSCNTFFYRLGLRLGIETLGEYAAYMGLGEDTGLEISQARGRFASPETTEQLGGTWYPGDLLQASIGQNETAVTPLQMACEAMTIANRGVRYETHLVRAVTEFGGEREETEPKVAASFEMSESTYQAVAEGMCLAAQKNGLPPGIAQKTGTAQTTSTDRVNNDFIAFLPVDDPEIAVSCIVEDCDGGTAALLTEIVEIYRECKEAGDILHFSQ